MKIAIAVDQSQAANHFGHCQFFVVYEVDNCEIKDESIIENPPHKKDFLPGFLKEKGINLVITGNIGQRAINLLEGFDIEVITGATGSSKDIIQKFLNDELVSTNSGCTEHENHSC